MAPMGDIDLQRRADLTFLALMTSAILATIAWAAFISGRTMLAVVLGVATLAAIGLTEFTDLEAESESKRWGSNGERWSMSDGDFDALIQEVEQGSRSAPAPGDADVGDSFEALLRDAIEELPPFVREQLDRNVVIVVADDGTQPLRYNADAHELYGLYVGWTAARGDEPARIVLFRDTLTRDFNELADLKEQVVITLRHEIAHHLGADEERVQELGL
jgi:predicted Zn-dependent protease with MMP-like domain